MTDFSRGQGPPPGFNQYGTQPGWGAQPPPAPKAKNRKPLIITAAATVAVLTVIAVVVAFLMSKGEGGEDVDPSGSPTEVAQAYMEALSRGDAQAALDLGATEPVSTELLTDDILKMQLEKLPITDVQVIGEERKPEDDKRTSAVKVAAKFGGQRTEGKLDMVVVDNQWKLTAAFVDASTERDNASTEKSNAFGDARTMAALTVFGKPLPQTRHVQVFPGYFEMGSATPYLKVNEMSPTPLDKVTAVTFLKIEPKISMTDEGREAFKAKVIEWFDTCWTAGEKTGECAWVGNDLGDGDDPASASAEKPIDLSAVEAWLPRDSSVVHTDGEVKLKVTVMNDGEQKTYWARGSAPYVDLGQQPPVAIEDK